MKYRKMIIAAPIALAVLMAGCGSTQPYGGTSAPNYPAQTQSYGYVDRIEVIQRGAANNVAGTIIGGVIGGLIGTQIGSGSGRTAATVAGAVGGAVAGNVIEGRRRADNETFRVTVRLDGGGVQTITQDNIQDLRTGDRVRVDGNVITRI